MVPGRGIRARRLAGRALGSAGLAAHLLWPVAARAHSAWFDGAPLPEWVAKACCGPGDAHHLRPDQVHRIPDGYLIEGYPKPIYDAQVLPSEDGEYWAFYGETREPDGRSIVTSVFCFFAPSWG